MAKHGRRLLNYLDDTPVVPGDVRHPFEYGLDARQVLDDAEAELHQWQPHLDPIESNAGQLGTNLMPAEDGTTTSTPGPASDIGTAEPTGHHHYETSETAVDHDQHQHRPTEGTHMAVTI